MKRHYRVGSSRNAGSLASFREQMADFARGQRLLDLREARHLSREFVAAELGVSTKSLYSWEHGGKIKWPNAQKVGAYYKVDPESLVARENGAAPVEFAETSEAQDQLDRIEARLADLVNELRGWRTAAAAYDEAEGFTETQEADERAEQRANRDSP